VEKALDRLVALDPGALLFLGKAVPLWVAPLLLVVGLALLVAGSRPSLRRGVAALAGTAAGWFLLPAATRALGVPFSHSAWVGAGAFGVLGAIRPAILAYVAGGIGGALLALRFWPGRLLAAALPGLVVGALLGALLRRALFSLAAAALGAVAAAVGATSLLLRTPAAGPVNTYPIVLLVAAGLLFICSAAYQLTRGEGRRRPALAMPSPKRGD
jgi:hypothetical protein